MPTMAGELQIWGVLTNSLLQLTFEVLDPGRITSLTLVIFLDMKLPSFYILERSPHSATKETG